MKRVVGAAGVAAVAAILMQGVGCDWSGGSGSDSFNTSQGAGVNVNISGVYDGNLGGGKAVSSTSRGTITRLTLFQTGNRVDVTDNQGSKYSGTVGTPAAVGTPDDLGVYQAGAELLQTQVTFDGQDNVAASDVSFVGIVHAVAVTDIKGQTSSQTVNDQQVNTTTSSEDKGDNVVTTITSTIGTPDDPFYSQTVTTITTDKATGKEISRTVTTTGVSTKTSTFQLTEANTQFRLEGTWIERDTNVRGDVDALSPGGSGVITYEQTVDEGTGVGGSALGNGFQN